MKFSDPVRMLQLNHIMRGQSENDIQRIVETLVPIVFEAGETITIQDTPVEGLVFIAAGEVQTQESDAEGKPRSIRLTAGDVLGESEYVLGLNWLTTFQATEKSVLLRWDRRSLDAFVQEHPDVLQHMQFAAESRMKARQLSFDWLNEGEVIFGLAQKHYMMLVKSLVLPLVMMIIGVWTVSWGFLNNGALIGWVGVGLFLVAGVYAVWRYFDWRNDYYIVTDRRAVWQEKVIALYDSRQEAPLYQVQAVGVSITVGGRIFGYGDVAIATYTGELPFYNLPNPGAMAAMVDEHFRRAQLFRSGEDEDEKEKAIREIVDGGKADEALELLEQKPPPEGEVEEAISQPTGLGHWSLNTRFEEAGTIVYRKHQVTLGQHIALPSLFIMSLLVMLFSRMAGLIVIGTVEQCLTISIIALIPLTAWLIYGYVDWRDDIYMVSPTHIFDIYKKPLGREVRKVAPLDNILGTEVDRRGLTGIMLNFGNVTSNVGTEFFEFKNVANPVTVQQDINRAQESLRERKRKEAQKQQRDEMVEWLEVYHKLAQTQDEPE